MFFPVFFLRFFNKAVRLRLLTLYCYIFVIFTLPFTIVQYFYLSIVFLLFSVFFPGIGVMDTARCELCSQFRPGRAWDHHVLCPLCRACKRADPCERCMTFGPEQWQEIDSWLQARRAKLQGRLDAIPDPLAPGPSGPGPKAPRKKVKKASRERGVQGKKGEPPSAGASCPAAKESSGVIPSGLPEGSAPTGATDRRSPVTVAPRDSEASAPDPGSLAPRSQGPEAESTLIPRAPTGPLVLSRSQAPQGAQGGAGPQAGSPDPAAGSRTQEPPASALVPEDGAGIPVPAPVTTGTQQGPDRSWSRDRSPLAQEQGGPSGSRGARRDSVDRASRSSSHSTRPSRGRVSSDTSDSEPDSDAGYRRDRSRRRRRRSPMRGPDPSDPAWVSQLASMLGPLISGEVAKQMAQLHPTTSDQAPLPPTAPEVLPQAGPSCSHSPHPDSLEVLASDEFDEDEDEGTEGLQNGPAPTSTPEDTDSPRGTSLPQGLLNTVAEVLTSKLGFEVPVRPAPSDSESRLSHTNEAVEMGPPEFPVDAHCQQRFETLASKRPWTAFPAQQEKAIRVPEEHWNSLFKPPSVSDEARNKVRAEQKLASGMFREPLRRRTEENWYQADLAARAGLKFSSVFLLVAEALRRAHLQCPGDEVQFSREDVGQLIYLLGPLSRLVFDQFSRVALKAVQVRRANILDVIPSWPSSEARGRLEQLPVVGPDLFNGQFLEKLAAEVKRHEETGSATFKPPPRPAPSPASRGASRGKPKPSKRPRARKPPKQAPAHGNPGWRAPPSGRGRGGRGAQAAKGRGRGTAGQADRPSYGAQPPTQFPPSQP